MKNIKLSKTMKAKAARGEHPMQRPEVRLKNSLSHKGKSFHTDEWKKELSERFKANNPMNDPGVRRRQLEGVRKAAAEERLWMQKPENKSRISISQKKAYTNGRISPMKDPKVAKKSADAQRGKPKNVSPEERKKRSERILRLHANGTIAVAVSRPEVRKRISDSAKARMATVPIEEMRKRCREMRSKARFFKPTSPERRVIELCEKFGLHLRYVGNGKLWLNHKGRLLNPDFIEMNGKMKIVEVFGDYWHSDEVVKNSYGTESGRTSAFRDLGYDTLILWEKDLKSMSDEDIACRLSSFLEI